jgi:hypothetical protein
MARTMGSALSFHVTGWAWIVLSALLGLAGFIGIVRGSPLPAELRLVHVHGTLVGGVLQILIGLYLASAEQLQPPTKRAGRLLGFFGYNVAASGLVLGSALRNGDLMIAAGVVLVVVMLPSARQAFRTFRTWPGWTSLYAFLFALAFLALSASVILGILLAGRWLPLWHGMLRLAHLHSGLLIGLVLIGVASIQLGLPYSLHRPLKSPGLGQAALLLLPACLAGLLTGFLLASVPIQLTAGTGLFIVLCLYAANLLRTWSAAGQPGSAATDHLLTALFFLLLTALMGLAVGYNVLSSVPIMPYGTLHLIAYTHQAFIGFLLHAIVGGLALTLPSMLARHRVPSHKKRPAYQAELDSIMNRWHTIQIATLSFGSLGLALVASLTWSLPLGSPGIQAASWSSFALLLTGVTLVTIKLTQVIATRPASDRSSHEHKV